MSGKPQKSNTKTDSKNKGIKVAKYKTNIIDTTQLNL